MAVSISITQCRMETIRANGRSRNVLLLKTVQRHFRTHFSYEIIYEMPFALHYTFNTLQYTQIKKLVLSIYNLLYLLAVMKFITIDSFRHPRAIEFLDNS